MGTGFALLVAHCSLSLLAVLVGRCARPSTRGESRGHEEAQAALKEHQAETKWLLKEKDEENQEMRAELARLRAQVAAPAEGVPDV